MMARVSLAPYTWSESTKMLEPMVDRLASRTRAEIRDARRFHVSGRWTLGGDFLVPADACHGPFDRGTGGTFMGASFAAMRLEKLVDLDPARIGKRAHLTARELAVLRWASFGRQVREIGHELGLSARSVRSRLKKAQAKLGAHNRTHAVSEALRQQLFP